MLERLFRAMACTFEILSCFVSFWGFTSQNVTFSVILFMPYDYTDKSTLEQTVRVVPKDDTNLNNHASDLSPQVVFASLICKK